MEEQREWQSRAACRPGAVHYGLPVDPDWWFPGRDGRGTLLAQEICLDRCPVRDSCQRSVGSAKAYGVWGGLTEVDRYGRMLP